MHFQPAAVGTPIKVPAPVSIGNLCCVVAAATHRSVGAGKPWEHEAVPLLALFVVIRRLIAAFAPFEPASGVRRAAGAKIALLKLPHAAPHPCLTAGTPHSVIHDPPCLLSILCVRASVCVCVCVRERE